MRDSKKMITAAAHRRAAFEAEQKAELEKKQKLKAQNRKWMIAAALSVVAAVAIQGLFAPAAPEDQPADSLSNSSIVPDPALAEARTWTGTLNLNDVSLGIELDGAASPQSTANFLSLAQNGFYKDLSCHRLTNGGFFILQCGDPNGNGQGGPGYTWGPIENAPSDNIYPAGTIAMARVGNDPNSQGSQFFIVYEDTQIPSDSAGGYSVFGRVTSGLDQLVDLVSTGVEGGGSDGKPVTPISIGTIALN